MTPAQRLAARNAQRKERVNTMSTDEARALGEQLSAAIVEDDEERGSKIAVQLLAGIAVNLARIADHLTGKEVP